MAAHQPNRPPPESVRGRASNGQPIHTGSAFARPLTSAFRLVREGNPIAIGILLFTLAVWTFLPCLGYGFVNFDDNVYVYENAHVPHGLTGANLQWALTTLDAGFWHPLTWLSLLVDGQLFGLRPGGYHLTALLLHAANTVLLFVVLRRLTGATWRGACVSALFALHPLHVEPVAWIANRKDVLSTLFWLLAMLMYVRYAQARSPDPPPAPGRASGPSVRYYLLALLFFACGLMSKTMVVTLPLILVLLDWWPLQRLRLKTLSLVLLEKVPFLAAAVVCGRLTMRAETNVGALMAGAALTIPERIANATVSYLRYLGETFCPRDLAVYYPYPATYSLWPAIGAGLVLLLVSIVLLWAATRRPYLAFGWIWYGITLLPVIGLIQVGSHSHADHYTYIPLIGVFVLLVWGACDLTRSWRYQAAILSATAALGLGLCVVVSRHQLGYWQNSETLLRHAIAVTGDNELMHNNLGAMLVGEGRLEEAIDQFRQAARLNPDSARVQDNLGAALAKQGKLDDAIQHLREAIRLDPNWADAHNNLGAALGRQGRLDEAVSHLQTAVRLTPRDAGAHCNLGDALASTGRRDEAIGQYQAALKLRPDDAETHYNLGATLEKQGRLDEAAAQFQAALQANPRLPNVRNALAGVLLRQGRVAEAIGYYQAAIDAQPGNAYLLNNLAWVLATSPQASARNGPRAIELAQQAERLSGGRNPSILGTLAAAYAEAGHFPEAVATAQRALALAVAQGRTADANSLRTQLAGYQAGSAFRDPSQVNPAPESGPPSRRP